MDLGFFDKKPCRNQAERFLICFRKFMHLNKLPTRSSVIILCEWIWDPLTRNLAEIRLRGFLYQGTIYGKKISLRFQKMVFISWVLTV